MTSSISSKRILDEKLIAFFMLKVLPVCFYREIGPFIIWVYIPLLDYDVSLHEVVELIV
jgi:hypothetical protein